MCFYGRSYGSNFLNFIHLLYVAMETRNVILCGGINLYPSTLLKYRSDNFLIQVCQRYNGVFFVCLFVVVVFPDGVEPFFHVNILNCMVNFRIAKEKKRKQTNKNSS